MPRPRAAASGYYAPIHPATDSVLPSLWKSSPRAPQKSCRALNAIARSATTRAPKGAQPAAENVPSLKVVAIWTRGSRARLRLAAAPILAAAGNYRWARRGVARRNKKYPCGAPVDVALAAVHQHGLAAHESGVVRYHERNRRRLILWLAAALDRLTIHDRIEMRLRHSRDRLAGARQSGCQCIYRDAEFARPRPPGRAPGRTSAPLLAM